MSTEDQNKAVVTLKEAAYKASFIEDMVSGTNQNEFMPGRKVELYNEKTDSLRNVDFVLTAEEAETLKKDPRVLDVRLGTKAENGFVLKSMVVDSTKTYSRSATIDSTQYNWAIPACTSRTNPFTSTNLNFQHSYTLTGNGVDAVIMDSGILPDHPEWQNLEGTGSRFQQVDWPTVSNLTGTYTQSPSHYTDTRGHGTHVAGIFAGRLYGWAKRANIYAITVVDNSAAFGISAAINMVRAWHNLKPVTSTGYKRPTILNMSWQYIATYTNINGGRYRGNNWTGTNPLANFGMVQTIYNRIGTSAPFTYWHPVRITSVDADLADCIAAGVIAVAAAGNDAHKIEISTGTDYNNYYNKTASQSSSVGAGTPGASVSGQVYYHRGGTPNGVSNVITVGSIRTSFGPEGKSLASNSGPGVAVYAPGESIVSAVPETNTVAQSVANYPLNENFRITKLGGTSMAAPQVAGVIACYAEYKSSLTPSQALAWVQSNSTKNRINDSGGGFTDTSSLQGSDNNYLFQPYNKGFVFKIG